MAVVETRLREDARIGILGNNAGASLSGRFIDQATNDVGRLVALNTTALVRLASAVAQWAPFEAARQAMLPGFAPTTVAERYRTADINEARIITSPASHGTATCAGG